MLISALWWSPLAPTELEDFEVEVKASGETVRAGQPFNITCVSPAGLNFHQQWLHPKKQASPFPVCLCVFFLFQFSLLSAFSSPLFPSTPCHISMSFPPQQH